MFFRPALPVPFDHAPTASALGAPNGGPESRAGTATAVEPAPRAASAAGLAVAPGSAPGLEPPDDTRDFIDRNRR